MLEEYPLIMRTIEAIADGKHNEVLIAIGGSFFVLVGVGRRIVVNTFLMVRLWYARRANAARAVDRAKEADCLWDEHIEGRVALLLDDHEIETKRNLSKVEMKIDHTNSLLESALTEQQAESNYHRKQMNEILDKLRSAGL